MTIEGVINLFRQIEAGHENQKIGFHLHAAIRRADSQPWPTNHSYPPTFSGFLEALRDENPQL